MSLFHLLYSGDVSKSGRGECPSSLSTYPPPPEHAPPLRYWGRKQPPAHWSLCIVHADAHFLHRGGCIRTARVRQGDECSVNAEHSTVFLAFLLCRRLGAHNPGRRPLTSPSFMPAQRPWMRWRCSPANWPATTSGTRRYRPSHARSTFWGRSLGHHRERNGLCAPAAGVWNLTRVAFFLSLAQVTVSKMKYVAKAMGAAKVKTELLPYLMQFIVSNDAPRTSMTTACSGTPHPPHRAAIRGVSRRAFARETRGVTNCSCTSHRGLHAFALRSRCDYRPAGLTRALAGHLRRGRAPCRGCDGDWATADTGAHCPIPGPTAAARARTLSPRGDGDDLRLRGGGGSF